MSSSRGVSVGLIKDLPLSERPGDHMMARILPLRQLADGINENVLRYAEF